MVRVLSACTVALFCLVGNVHPQDKPGPAPTITWHGQSFFEVRSSKGTNIVIDPHLIAEYGRIQGVKADAILVTHPHSEHNQVSVVENFEQAKILVGLKGNNPQRAVWNNIDENIKEVRVRTVGLYHDDLEGMRYGKNTAFVLEMDGWKIAHLGDLGHALTEDQLKAIGPVDVIMIPVGGIYTLNGGEARRVVEQLKPREYVFPMHMGTKIYDKVLSVDEFIDDLPRNQLAISDDNKVVLNRDPQRPRPLTVLLHYWPKVKKE